MLRGLRCLEPACSWYATCQSTDTSDFNARPAGFCTAYLVFIKENLASFTGQPANLCVAALLPFLLALSTLRGVASLAPFSLVADAANAIGACHGCCACYGFRVKVRALTCK